MAYQNNLFRSIWRGFRWYLVALVLYYKWWNLYVQVWKVNKKVIFDLLNILLAQDTTGIDKNSEELLVWQKQVSLKVGFIIFVTILTTTQRNTTSTLNWVGHKMTMQTPPHHPPTTETQQQPLWASEQHSLLTTKYSVISNNKQGHNNNNNNNNNNINNKIISFRSLRLTFIDHN